MNTLRTALWSSAGVAAVSGLALAAWSTRNLKSFDLLFPAVRRAGYTEHHADVDGVTLHYARGPKNDGPPLLLVHGQGVEWTSYYRTLPALSRSFQVFVVDVHGHGRSDRAPGRYRARTVGTDLAAFVEDVIGEPALVSGHSSGGQLAAWLGGHRPDLVRGLLLEDPPLFTTPLPRARDTWNWVDLASTCHIYLTKREAGSEVEWNAFQFAHQKLWDFFGEAREKIVAHGLRRQESRPGRPITLFFMPPGWNEMQVSLSRYDPEFGEAFYTGAWDAGFDQAKTLAAISAPTTLVHTKVSYEDGILLGAMDNDDAARAAGLIADCILVEANTGHNFHGEDPRRFVRLLAELAERI